MHFFPVVPIAIEDPPALGDLAGVVRVVVNSPIDLDRVDLFWPGKIILHPLGGAFSAKPDEAGNSGVIRIPGKKLVIQANNIRGPHAGRSAPKSTKHRAK